MLPVRTRPFTLRPAALVFVLALLLAALPGRAQEINDPPAFVRGADVETSEDAGPQSIAGWATVVSAGPVDESAQTLAFGVSHDHPALFAVPPALDAAGTLTFTPAAHAYGTATVTVILKDNGGTANGGTDQSAPQTFTITLTPVNDAPSFAPAGPVTVLENAGIVILENWATAIAAGPANESAQAVTFSMSNDSPALFSRPPALSAEGTLTFTPAPGANGTAIVTVILRDNGGAQYGGQDQSAPQTFTLTVLPVNNAPAFAKGANMNVIEDAGPQSITGWATALSAGPADEATQALSFTAATDAKDLFSRLPALDAAGMLTFTPAAHAYGTATVTVILKDNGGTANGGTDQSASQTFTITLVPVNDAPYLDTPAEVFLTQNSPPHTLVLTGISPGPGESGQGLTFAAVSDNPSLLDITSAAYAPGSTTASLIFQPRPGQTGTTSIAVRLKDNGGTANDGQDTYLATFRVTVAPEAQALFLPTLFSPNADGQNDVFRLRGGGIASVQLRVFSQSGIEVFRAVGLSPALQSGWDGTYQGRPVPAGVYTWTLTGRYNDGQPLTAGGKTYGQVTLVR